MITIGIRDKPLLFLCTPMYMISKYLKTFVHQLPDIDIYLKFKLLFKKLKMFYTNSHSEKNQ